MDLEIALSGVPAKVQPHELLQPGRRCVETSDDEIKYSFTRTPDSRIWDLSPMRLGAAKTARESAKSPDNPALLPTKRLTAFLELERIKGHDSR